MRACAVAAVTSAAAVVLTASSAGAISDESMCSPRSELDAPIIFEGTAVEEVEAEYPGVGVPLGFVFDVDEVWKGDVPRRVVVHVDPERGWALGQSGLVLAGNGRLDDELDGSAPCSDDAELRSAMVAANLEPRPPADDGIPLAIAAAGVLAVVIVGALLRRSVASR